MTFRDRHDVEFRGDGPKTLVLIHGYGCDKTMWDAMVPRLEGRFKLVIYNLAGSGQASSADYDRDRYASLHGHADDLVQLIDELQLDRPVIVGHSVSAMTAALAANTLGSRVAEVIMVCPSPSFIDDGDYVGGFERADIDALLETLDANYLGWSSQMAPAIMGAPEAPEHGERLTASFCSVDPEIARHFARVTFLSDHRADVAQLQSRTLVLQCQDDVIVPPPVGAWLEKAIPDAELVVLDATGHCPHISYPDETAAAIASFLDAASA